mgnify:CR=1 FL=1
MSLLAPKPLCRTWLFDFLLWLSSLEVWLRAVPSIALISELRLLHRRLLSLFQTLVRLQVGDSFLYVCFTLFSDLCVLCFA